MYPMHSTAAMELTPVTPRLTPRDRDLIRAIRRGFSNREIATELGISQQTVKNQLTMLYDKLNVRGRLQLALRAPDADCAP